MCATERDLLAHTSNREGLAREATRQNVVVGDLGWIDPVDVTSRTLTMPRLIGLLGEPIPLGREDALTADRLQPKPEAANPRKQVDELEGSFCLGSV